MGLVGLPACHKTAYIDCHGIEIFCQMTVTGFAGKETTGTCEQIRAKGRDYLAKKAAQNALAQSFVHDDCEDVIVSTDCVNEAGMMGLVGLPACN